MPLTGSSLVLLLLLLSRKALHGAPPVMSNVLCSELFFIPDLKKRSVSQLFLGMFLLFCYQHMVVVLLFCFILCLCAPSGLCLKSECSDSNVLLISDVEKGLGLLRTSLKCFLTICFAVPLQ